MSHVGGEHQVCVVVDAVLPWTVVVARTGVDEHHGPLDHPVVGTGELHLRRLGAVRGAAAAVGAEAAEARAVGLDTGAVLKGEVDGLDAPFGL